MGSDGNQILAATTNGTSGNQTFGITTGTLNCLRRVAALLTTADTSYISIINPMCIPATGIDCPHFQNAEKIHVAWGISHLLDNVPYKDGTNSASTIQYAINSKRCKFPSSFALFT
jgi:hypothetical protein